MAADPMLFQFIGESLTGAMDAYVNSVAPALIGQLVGTAVLATTIYYVWLGYMVAFGRVDGAMSAVVISAIKFGAIAAFALSANGYMEFVVGAIHSVESGLAHAFSGGSGTAPDNVYKLLDNALGEGWGLMQTMWEKAANRGITEFGMAIGEYLMAVMILAATCIIAAPAGAMIIVAKTVLELLLGIGPIFIMALMWSPTRAFFDRWIAAILTRVLQIALICAVLAFALKMFMAYVAATDIESEGQSPLFASVCLLLITIVLLIVLYEVNNLAASLAGGISSGAITFGNMVRGSANMATAPGRMANALLNPVSTRRDLESGMMVTAGRLNHLVAGNTAVWNPRYRQHVLNNVGKNWGRAEGGSVKGQ